MSLRALNEKKKPKYIRENENMFFDQTRIAAYQIGTWMMQFFELMGHRLRQRTVLKALFEADADIIPEPEKGILRVRILGMPSKDDGQGGRTAAGGIEQDRNEIPGYEIANGLRASGMG